MQVSVETTSGLERRMMIEVPGEQVDQEVQSRLQNLARTVKLNGFRPGKIPFKVVARQFGAKVRQEVLGEVIRTTFYEAVVQEKLNPVGVPNIETDSTNTGESIKFTATFEVMPTFVLADVSGIRLERFAGQITDADVDKMLESLRVQRAEWEEVPRAAAVGDRVNVDLEAMIDGELFADGTAKDVYITLGDGKMIPGFEEGLVGAQGGGLVTLDLSFPSDYPSADIAGKPVNFKVMVNRVEEQKLPELNDELAKSFGVGNGIDALRDEVRQSMKSEMAEAIENKLKLQVMDKLIELHNIEVPRALIEDETRNLRQQMQAQMGNSDLDLSPSAFEDKSYRRVALGLILSNLVKEKGLIVDQSRVRERVERIAATFEDPEKMINWYYGDKKRLADIESLVLEEKVVEWILSQANISVIEKGFHEIVSRNG